MTKYDKFLAFINLSLKEILENYHLNELEKKSIQLSVYDIFESSSELEEIYYKLLDYFDDEEPILRPLTEKVEEFFAIL